MYQNLHVYQTSPFFSFVWCARCAGDEQPATDPLCGRNTLAPCLVRRLRKPHGNTPLTEHNQNTGVACANRPRVLPARTEHDLAKCRCPPTFRPWRRARSSPRTRRRYLEVSFFFFPLASFLASSLLALATARTCSLKFRSKSDR